MSGIYPLYSSDTFDGNHAFEAEFSVYDKTAVLGNQPLKNSIALGIYISLENAAEKYYQGQYQLTGLTPSEVKATIGTRQSSFANEDLVSNLIGFHAGLDIYQRGLSGQEAEE